MQKSKRTKHGHKLLHVKGSPFWYVEGTDFEGKAYRQSTRTRDDELAAQVARRIVLERAVPQLRPYALSEAYIALLKQKQMKHGGVSAAEMEVVKEKAARVMEFFKPSFNCNEFTRERIEEYVAKRRADRIYVGHPSERCVSDSTIGKELTKLFEALTLAKKEKHFHGEVDALHTDWLRPPEKRTTHLTEEQFLKLWRALATRARKSAEGTKVAWIESLPVDMPAKEVVALARSRGMELTASHVWTVRYQQRERSRAVDSGKRKLEDRSDYILMYVSTGARFGELGRIQAVDIDHDLGEQQPVEGVRELAPHTPNPRLRLHGKKGHADYRVRWVPLPPDAYEVLCRRAKANPEGPLFSRWDRGSLNKMLRRVCEEVGIPRCTTNDLRRTFVTWHGKHRTDAFEVKKMMGHSPTSRMVDSVYRQLHNEAGRAAADRFPRVRPPEQQPPEDNVVQLPVRNERS